MARFALVVSMSVALSAGAQTARFSAVPQLGPVLAGIPVAPAPSVGLFSAAMPALTMPVLRAAVSSASSAPKPKVEAPVSAQRPSALSGIKAMSAAFSASNAPAGGQFLAGTRQFDGAAVGSTYRYPTYAEQSKIDESLRRGVHLSPVARDLISEFYKKGGQFAVDDNAGAAYHATAFRDTNNRPTVALTLDTVGNGSWAFILAAVGREVMNFNDWYAGVPASAERLAVQYAHMAMIFAEATNGSARAWSTNLDHNHRNEGTYFVWAWYEKMLQAMTSATVGFIDSEFYVWLRDFVAKQTASNPAYQYSLYERLTGRHYRPGTALHDTPIPAAVERLEQGAHDAASQRIYGADGNGDKGSEQSLLGYLRSWFARRGNI